MTIQEKIKADVKTAMLAKETQTRDILRVVIGEFNRIGKEVSDTEATATIKKMVANAQEMKNESEVEILSAYLPKQLTEDQLDMLISQIIEDEKIDSMRGMGKIMSELQRGFAGQYDGKLASKIVKEKLG